MSSIYVDKAHAEYILQQLWQDCEIEELCDVVLIADNDGIRVPAHRNVLSAASSYFKEMFKSSMCESTTKEIKMSSVSGAILRSLVEYCYTGRVAITDDNAVELYKLADSLFLSNVLKACKSFLSKELHPSNCLGLILSAEQFRCEILLENAKEYSYEHFMDVSKTQEFLSLNSEQLSEFLASDNLCVPAEENVFEILMTWLQHNPIEREQHKDQLLKLVRLPLLERSFLIEQVEPICTSIESHQLYVDALEWQLLPDQKIIDLRKSIYLDKYLICLTCKYESSRIEINFYYPQRLKWMRCLKNLDFRCGYGVAVMHNNLYLVGGSSQGNPVSDTVICINLKTMTIGQINPMTEPRAGCGAAVLKGYLYAVGGHNGHVRRIGISSVEKWNKKTNTWSEVASMSVGRYAFGIAELNYKLYVVGGYTDEWCLLNSAEYYDLHQNVWISIAPMKEYRNYPHVAVANGLMYVTSDDSDKVECYDPRRNKWTMVSSVPQIKKCFKCCTTFCNKVLVCCDDRFYEFNDKTNEWKTKENLSRIKNVSCLVAYSEELSVSEFTEN